MEHRWAVNNRNGEGENNRVNDSFEKRRLGNFVLLELRLNIQGSNDNIGKKRNCYVVGKDNEPPTDLHQVRRMFKDAEEIEAKSEFINRARHKNYYLDLNRQINDCVEARLTKFALKRWSLKDYLGFKKLKALSESGYENQE